MALQLTLCIVQDGDRVLLGKKQRGLGAGRWNGFGGKIEPGETVAAAAVRELHEEAGIVAHDALLVGIVDFTYDDQAELAAGLSLSRQAVNQDLELHIFRVTQFSGEPKVTAEMEPEWFTVDAIPYDEMWPDDRYWLPLVLAGKQFRMRCVFRDKDTLISHELKELAAIEESWHKG